MPLIKRMNNQRSLPVVVVTSVVVVVVTTSVVVLEVAVAVDVTSGGITVWRCEVSIIAFF